MHPSVRPIQKLLFNFAVALIAASAMSMAFAQSVPMLVQAEAMSVPAGSTAPMATGNDIAAMGGRFITSGSGATTTTTPAPGASVQVTVPSGTYFLWARMAGPTPASDALYVGIDSSFARIFPTSAPSGAYEWVRVATSDGGTNFAFALGGTHTIQVGYGEVGAKLDAVYLTANSAEVPSFAPPLRLAFEGEAMALTAPMTVGNDPAANGGKYVSPTSGTDSTTPVREASVTLDVPAGTYYLWARIAGPTGASNALYAGIDSSFARIFTVTAFSGAYEWVKVATTNGGSVYGFSLSAGTHTIQVGHGEIGARLDGLYLTTDASEVPTTAPMRRVIEAESFNLQTTPPTMVVGTDAGANGAQYLTTTSTTDSITPVREAWTTVNAPVAGTYYLWARIAGANINSDALYAGFGTTFVRIFPQTSNGAYEWVRVEAPGSVNGFALNAGANDIQIGHGEVGARLDALYVTDSANDSPPGAASQSGFPEACALPTGGYPGFGRNTLKDAALPTRTVIHVNSLADPSEAGKVTLRDALSQPNRCVVFDVGGPINLVDQLKVSSNVIIDGFTAPSPGITLVNTVEPGPDPNSDPPALVISSLTGTVSNVVVRGLRVRLSPGDAIRLYNASNVVIDHVSVSRFRDGGIDVTQPNSHDVTIQWSIIGNGQAVKPLAMLLSQGATRISVHHNLFFNNADRQPKCGGTSNTSPVCDTRNNLVWSYTQNGTVVQDSGTGNVINNYYKAGPGAIPNHTINVVENGVPGDAFVDGNFSQENYNVHTGTRNTEFPVDLAYIQPTSPRDAAIAVRGTAGGRDGAGARGRNFELDQDDKDIVNSINIP